MNYSELLSKYVKESGLSLSEISKRMKDRGIKIDKSYISKLQNGVVNPPSTEITLTLAEVLGGDPEQLAWAALIDKNDPEKFQMLMKVNRSLIKRQIELDLKYPIPDDWSDQQAEEYLDSIDEYRVFFEQFREELEKLISSSEESDQKKENLIPYLTKLENMVAEPVNKYSTQKIPLVGTICAGDGLLAQQNIEDYIYYPLPGKRQPDFALRVKGSSMINAGISDGDIVYLREAQWADYNGQIVAVVLNDNEDGTLKRMKWSEDSPTIRLVPENDEFDTIEVLPTEIRVCGVYMGHFTFEKN